MTDIEKYGFVGTEGLLDTIKGFFSKKKEDTSSNYSEIEKPEIFNCKLTRKEFIKEANEFFKKHADALYKEFKKYPKGVEEYDIGLSYYKYKETNDRIGIEITYSKHIAFQEDKNSEGYKIASLFGNNPYGDATFTNKMQDDFKSKFGFPMDWDGTTRETIFMTPLLSNINFKDTKTSGTESEYNIFDI